VGLLDLPGTSARRGQEPGSRPARAAGTLAPLPGRPCSG